jgi:hypothetical protein
MLKLDVGGAFLCANMDDTEEVYMILDKQLSDMCKEWIPEVEHFIRKDGKLVVRVNRAIYGLIQSAKLWYKKLSGYLTSKGFKTCKSDKCILVKRMADGKHVIVILYADDILVLSGSFEIRHWVKAILVERYDKIMSEEGSRPPYLGMTIVKRDFGFKFCMRSYIDEVIKFYGKGNLREYVIPATNSIYQIDEKLIVLDDKTKFQSVVTKLLYLGKRFRPDILIPAQFLCTRVQAPTKQDVMKLERMLGYLQLTRS